MKLNRYGRAAILTPAQISLLFTEGFVKPRDKALASLERYLGVTEQQKESAISTLDFLGTLC